MVTRRARPCNAWRGARSRWRPVLRQTIEFSRADRVFKARQGWLRSQITACDRIAVEQHLVNGSSDRRASRWHRDSRTQSRTRAVPTTRAKSDPPCRLAACRAGIRSEPRSIRSGGPQPSAGWLRIGTAIPLIELQHGRLGKTLREQQTLCRVIFNHAGSLSCCSNCLDNLFVAQLASRAFTFVHNAAKQMGK